MIRRIVRLTPHRYGYGWQIHDDITGDQILDVSSLDIEVAAHGRTFVRLVHVDIEASARSESNAPSCWAEWCEATFTPPDPDFFAWRPPALASEGR